MAKNPKRSNTAVIVLLTLLIIVMIAATGLMIWLCIDLVNKPAQPGSSSPGTLQSQPAETTPPTETQTVPPTTTEPEPVPEHVVSTATIGSMGDLLMHEPLFKQNYNSVSYLGNNEYDFTPMFEYLAEYASIPDLAVANLETTLCSTDNGYGYSGYPHFNCPDEIVDGAKDAGFDMLLTGNNHSYDTTLVGYKRTLEVIREKELGTLGTMLSADEPKYVIQDINGIKIGMISYTYANYDTEDGRPSLNGNAPIAEAGICNYFVTGKPAAFYTEIEGYLQEMEDAGAEATVVYMHWGVEYNTFANNEQKTIAQKLCDLGVDVIIGGHPHVVQPVDLLESTVDPDHKTVIIYSMGNAVSNQRLGNLSAISTAHTEDGVMFSITFEKYSDGTVYLAGADVLPTWVNKFTNSDGKLEYNILPLDDDRRDSWKDMFDIGDNTFNACVKSYDRTMAIVGEGLEECRAWLEQQKLDREEYYYNLAFFPEMFATEAAEPETTPTETLANAA